MKCCSGHTATLLILLQAVSDKTGSLRIGRFEIICRAAGTYPIIDFGQLELPEPAYFIGGHFSFCDPLQNGFAPNAKILLHFLEGGPFFNVNLAHAIDLHILFRSAAGSYTCGFFYLRECHIHFFTKYYNAITVEYQSIETKMFVKSYKSTLRDE